MTMARYKAMVHIKVFINNNCVTEKKKREDAKMKAILYKRQQSRERTRNYKATSLELQMIYVKYINGNTAMDGVGHPQWIIKQKTRNKLRSGGAPLQPSFVPE